MSGFLVFLAVWIVLSAAVAASFWWWVNRDNEPDDWSNYNDYQ